MEKLNVAKSLLLQDQKGIDKEKLVEDISLGKSPLLKAEHIAERLDIPLGTFHQWVRNGSPQYRVPPSVTALGKALLGDAFSEPNHITFPKPDLYIGSSPRWTLQTLQNWLRIQMEKAG